MNGLALCAGIGGLELGLQLGFGSTYRTVCYVERDPAAVRVLRARQRDGRLHDAPIHGNLLTFDGTPWRGAVDIVSAGFPCQPFSTASRGRRVAADLWPEVLRVALECGAPLVFCENVHWAPIERACGDLARAGFRTRYTRVAASSVGAPHRRVRWWLFADLDDAAQSVLRLDAEVAGVSATACARWAAGPGSVLGMDDGVCDRVDRVKLLGNSAIPAQAAEALRVLSTAD